MLRTATFQAKRVFKSANEAIENGIVEINDGVIVDVRKSKTPSSSANDLGSVAIVPGFVNAHTHLEFSSRTQPIGRAGMPFTDWLKLVVDDRTNSAVDDSAKRVAIRSGVEQSINSGVVAIGEIATSPISAIEYGDELKATIFFERLTRNLELLDSVLEDCNHWLSEPNESEFAHYFGKAISPHAPYSVSPELLKQLVALSVRSNCPVAMHVAETRDEIELLSHQTGAFVVFLKSLGAWYPESFEPGVQVIDYLRLLSHAPRTLIVHGNYLNDADIRFISNHKSKMSIVYCPRTHDYFQHEPYRLHEYLSAGINVAIGTDSKASNPDLNMFRELQFVKKKFPELDDHQIIGLGTKAGATALGLAEQFGSIAPGRTAQFNAIEMDDEDLLFSDECDCRPISCFF